jgi:hypothetical protein
MNTHQKQIQFFTKEDINNLLKIRIIKKNLVHVHGFPKSLADVNILHSNEYFGQYGKILKIVLSCKINPDNNKKVYSAYITYSNEREAAYAILCVDSLLIEGKIIRAFFGTTKYCKAFLNNSECQNLNKCFFLHQLIDDKDIIINNISDFSYDEHINLSKKIIRFFDPQTKDKVQKKVRPKNIKFPFIDFIFLKEEEKENYFSSGNISYIKTSSKALNNIFLNEKKSQFNNNYNEKNILYFKNVYNNINLNNYVFLDKNINNVNNNLNFYGEINPNFFESDDLLKSLNNCIKHILKVKPFYSKLKNYPLKKLELDYFKKQLEKSGKNLDDLFKGCLDGLKNVD